MKMPGIVKKVIGMGLPLLGGALGGPGGNMVGSMIAGALGVDNDANTINAALAQPEAIERLRVLEIKHKAKLEAIIVKNSVKNAKDTQDTYRMELKHGDKWVSRMRPTYGYVIAFCTLLLFITGCTIALTKSVETISAFVGLVTALAFPLSAGIGVLGVYVHSRGREKQANAGVSPAMGIVQSLINRGK